MAMYVTPLDEKENLEFGVHKFMTSVTPMLQDIF